MRLKHVMCLTHCADDTLDGAGRTRTRSASGGKGGDGASGEGGGGTGGEGEDGAGAGGGEAGVKTKKSKKSKHKHTGDRIPLEGKSFFLWGAQLRLRRKAYRMVYGRCVCAGVCVCV